VPLKIAYNGNHSSKLNEEESRDNATSAYHSDDNDSFTCTLYSREDGDDAYDDDDVQTRFSRQYSTCTDDDDSRFTSQVKLTISSDDADDYYDDNRSLFSADTDANITLTTVEEREFESFVRRQDLLAACREEKEATAEGSSTTSGTKTATKYPSPTISRFCANLFDLCGFLGEEIADDVDPQSTKSRRRYKEACNNDEEDEEKEEATVFDEYDVNDDYDGTVNQAVEECVLDIFEDFHSSHAISAQNTTADGEDIISTKDEEQVVELVPHEQKRKGWRKFRPALKLLPILHAKREAEKSISNVNEKHENVVITDTAVNEKPSSNEAPMGPKSSRKKTKIFERSKNTRNSSQTTPPSAGDGADAAVAPVAHRRTRMTKASKCVGSADDIALERAPDEKNDIAATRTNNASSDEIPFSALTIARGRSISKEHFSQVIEREEAKVKTIKKVKVGTDECGKETFAYLVIMSDSIEEQHIENKNITQLIRGNIDDSRMELCLARTKSLEMVDQNNQEICGKDGRYILMEVDDLTVGAARTEETTLNIEDDVTGENAAERIPSDANDREMLETNQQDLLPLPVPTKNTSQTHNAVLVSTKAELEPAVNFFENCDKDNSALEVLSFESVITQKALGVDEFSEGVVTTVPMTRDLSTTTQAFDDELMLMEAEDDDEIEIELEDDDDDDEEEEENNEMLPSFPSDCKPGLLGAGTAPEVNTGEEKVYDQRFITPRRHRMKPLTKFWKSKKRTNYNVSSK
jgi:antitoxin (DNA-binding transcriptional repressor) of toxin-antitoxin stability system